MCQSLAAGGKRCASCNATTRRGKDRAAYKAKRFAAPGSDGLWYRPEAGEMELARAGKVVESTYDSTSNLSGNDDFLLQLTDLQKSVNIFETSGATNKEGITMSGLEVEVRNIGAMIDSRARKLANIDAQEISKVKTELDRLLTTTRKKSKAKLKRIEKASNSRVSTNVDSLGESTSETTQILPGKAPRDPQEEATQREEIREVLFTLESGGTPEVLELLSNLREGYCQALREVRLMGSGEVLGFLPDPWLKSLNTPDMSSHAAEDLNYRSIVPLVQARFPILPALEGEFVRRRAQLKGTEPVLESYGFPGNEEHVLEGYFVDRYMGKVPAGASKDWELLSCGLEAIGGQRLSLGGLIGVGPGQIKSDDDMRQFVLGVLAVIEA